MFVSRYYGDTYFHITLVEVIGFLGMMAGGLLISTWGGFKRHTKTLLVGMVSFGLLATLMGSVKNFYMYLVLMAVYEVALTMVQTVSTTLLQENSTPEMSGRVFGLFGAAYSSLLPIDMVVFGLLADKNIHAFAYGDVRRPANLVGSCDVYGQILTRFVQFLFLQWK